MKKITLLLFIVGGLAQIASFLVSMADSIPPILAILAPRYAGCARALDTLEAKGHLEPTDNGFRQLEQLLRQRMCENNPPANVAQVQILRVRHGDMSINPDHPFRNIRLDLSNNQSIDYDLKEITSRVENMKQRPFLRYAATLFILGLLVESIAFGIEYVRDDK